MILILLSTLVVMYFLYAALHEAGHGIIGICCGGKISKFNIGFKPHIQIDNARYTVLTHSLMYANGVLFPYIISVFLIFKYDIYSENTVYHFLYMIFATTVSSSIIPWIIMPLVCPKLIHYDDIGYFIRISKVRPIIVSFVALLLFLVSIFLTFHSGIFGNVFAILQNK